MFLGMGSLPANHLHCLIISAPTPDWKETVNEIVEGVDGILSGIIGWWNEARRKRCKS